MSGNQTLDTATSIGRLMLSVIGAVGPAERGPCLGQREGIAKAKREGCYKRRVPTARRQATDIMRLKDAGIRPTEIAVRLVLGEQVKVAS
jgi:DNA invertase Pin-like site-specific DNA recombinase